MTLKCIWYIYFTYTTVNKAQQYNISRSWTVDLPVEHTEPCITWVIGWRRRRRQLFALLQSLKGDLGGPDGGNEVLMLLPPVAWLLWRLCLEEGPSRGDYLLCQPPQYHLWSIHQTIRKVFVRLKISGRSNQQGFNNYNNPSISVRRLISCLFPAAVRVPYEADDHWQNRFAAFPLYLQSEHRRPDSRVAIRICSPLPHLEMAFKCIVYNVYVREAHLTLTSFHSTALHSESTIAITAWNAPLNLIFSSVINVVLGASIEVRKDTAEPQREMLQDQREYHRVMIYTGMKSKAVWFHSVWNSVLDSPGH